MTATASTRLPSSQPDDWAEFVSAAPPLPPHPAPSRRSTSALRFLDRAPGSHSRSHSPSPAHSPSHSPARSRSRSPAPVPRPACSPHPRLLPDRPSSVPSPAEPPPSPTRDENGVQLGGDRLSTHAFQHPQVDARMHHHSPHHSLSAPDLRQPLQGFDTLDPVQRYAVGALAVVLLNHHAADLNGAAFARTQAAGILHALNLTHGQNAALLALEPTLPTRRAVVAQCVSLVGHSDARFLALQAMLALSVAGGMYDARSRAFLASVASEFGISWRAVAAVELAVAIHIFDIAAREEDKLQTRIQQSSNPLPADQADSVNVHQPDSTAHPDTQTRPKSVDQLLIERRKKKMRVRKAMKISGITLVGGMLFGLTGGLIAPALLSALAGVGVASAAGLAASGTLASGAVVGGLFGVAGAGFTVKKARHRISTNLEEFDFERPDDPRVVEARKRKEERKRRKLEKLVAERLAREAAAANAVKQIEGPAGDGASSVDAPVFDTEKELPRPPESSEEEDEEEAEDKRRKRFGMRRKKRPKQRVGSRGLEAAGQIPNLHVCICVPAWLTERSFGAALDQFEPGLKIELPCSQHIAMRWESRRLYEMGLAFAKFWASKATVTTIQQAYPHAVAAASTVAGAVAFAFAIPLTIMSCMDYIDNPWSILVSRSNGAGNELADVLVERSYGNRPVTLFGYSLGARVIFKCLESLASRGALGIVHNVYLMGAAVTADPERWKKIRPVVAGRIVNAYGTDDWALAFFHRGCGNGVYVSGLRRVEIDGVENLNMSYLGIEGHRELKDCVPRVMSAMGMGVGYIVMPPARLVYKRPKSKGSHRAAESPSCEDPGERGNSSGTTSPSSSENGDHVNHLGNMQKDKLWINAAHDEDNRDAKLAECDVTVELPPAIGSEGPTETGVSETLPSSSSEEEKSTTAEASKKKKTKSWLSWKAWSSHGSKSKGSRKSVRKSQESGHEDSRSVDATSVASSIEVNEDVSPIPVVDGVTSGSEHNDDMVTGKEVQVSDGSEGSTALDMDGEEFEEGEPFDWEKQRRIWEEQERQMQERGFADSAEDIEMRDKVILNISAEVAGRRLFRFIDQDEQHPVAKKEEVFTNCLEDQRGMLIRIYEHEKRTTSVPINMVKCDEQYPKCLGQLEIRLRTAEQKGKLRVSVAMWVNERGDVHASAEERLTDGSVADQAEICIPREELCTMAKRKQLDTAERKRIEAQVQKEMRNRKSTSVRALPAPPADQADSSSRDAAPDADSPVQAKAG